MTIDCANPDCSEKIDTIKDTHYRIDERERPVDSLEKPEDELAVDDFIIRGWYVCETCVREIIHF